ncbi:sugar ABC transporter permease [uncultured Desulfosarcina sp.]|uniref:carbohydrate ABC transporter permease n=1 Tax=uncultured Desulfosarcina sp. TaxID=218289 RepID=UPI0029C660F5|nr:sugar ABC transporter permease [uncultured Desulfosarcina sp.]
MNPKIARQVYGWLLFTPAALFFILFTHYPIVRSCFLSLFNTPRGNQAATFVGLENYRYLVDDPIFWQALKNNLIYAFGTIPVTISLAMVMAVWVNRQMLGRAFVRVAYFTPTILPMIAIANIWLFFYTPGIGLFDNILKALGYSGHNWLGDPNTALICLMVIAVWKDAGFFMIFYLAALQGLPKDVIEAGRIEGAGRFYFFRRVTFPLLMPTTVFVVFNALINTFRIIDHIFILTKGGPNNATELLLYYLFQTAFEFWDTSYAAVLTVVIMAILMTLALVQFKVLERRTHYQ